MDKLVINDDANFIRFNGRVYSLNDVGKCKLNDVIEATKSSLEAQANKYIEGVSDEVVNLMQTQESSQLDHLHRVQSAAGCMVPIEQFKKPMVCFNNSAQGYSEIRETVFCPDTLYFGRYGLNKLKDRLMDEYRYVRDGAERYYPAECIVGGYVKPENLMINTEWFEQWKAMCIDIMASSATWTIKTHKLIPAQIIRTWFDGQCIWIIRYNNNTITCHPHQMGGGNLCMGGVDGPTYWAWARDVYNKALNHINYESLANSGFDYLNILGDYQYFDNVKELKNMKYVSFTKEGASTWQTRRT